MHKIYSTTFKMVLNTHYRNFGGSIFVKGLEAKLIQSVLTSGFMFLSYEKILHLTQALMRIQKWSKCWKLLT